MVQIIIDQAADLKKSPKTPDDVLVALQPFAPDFAKRVLAICRLATA